MKTPDGARRAVCDFVWGLLEPWDEQIKEHDAELHGLLDGLVLAVCADISCENPRATCYCEVCALRPAEKGVCRGRRLCQTCQARADIAARAAA